MTSEELQSLMEENNRRKRRLVRRYDPESGLGCIGRRQRSEWLGGEAWLPVSLLRDEEYQRAQTDEARVVARFRHDFEYWAWKCVIIRDKGSGLDVPFKLNVPQRRVAGLLEADRRANRPIRMILLKARQWGGSTLIQVYMAWIQICLRRNWNSVISAHVKDTSAMIRGMYTKLLENYPREYWTEKERPEFKSYERSANIRTITGRGCTVSVGSAESQDSVRGGDYAMAHLSEVAYWRSTPQSSPEMFIRAICGSINYTPLTMVVLESTANGVGNYFHREWLRAVNGESDKRAVFVPWHEIEIYRCKVADVEELWEEMDEYEHGLWKRGLTIEMIGWFHQKRKELGGSLKMMLAEFPSTDVEAFDMNDMAVFDKDDVEALRVECKEPKVRGEVSGKALTGASALEGVKFTESGTGGLEVWKMPKSIEKDGGRGRYYVGVDIGGRSESSDWSVIAVVDRRGGISGDMPEVVAQWRGHIDHDLLAWKACAIGAYWNNAQVVFESNTLETETTDGDPSLFILNEVRRHYRNLYRRPSSEGMGRRIGFHTNRATKTMIINKMIAAVRERRMVEHSHGALNELLTYRIYPNGTFGAQDGCHDDMLMARAIAMHAASLYRVSTATEDAELKRYLVQYGGGGPRYCPGGI